jgi:hypothetical protein
MNATRALQKNPLSRDLLLTIGSLNVLVSSGTLPMFQTLCEAAVPRKGHVGLTNLYFTSPGHIVLLLDHIRPSSPHLVTEGCMRPFSNP